jgi:4-carboxymuconolactone decarboxylase
MPFQSASRTRQEVRRAVMGDEASLDHSALGASELAKPLRELADGYCWDVWARPQLALQTRCLVTVATLAALDRPRQLRVHIAGALRNGSTPGEVAEVLLHTALYAGLPAAANGFIALIETVGAAPGGGEAPAAPPAGARRPRTRRAAG